MFRKFALALIATAAVGTATLSVSTTPAEAWPGGGWKKHHHHHHWRSGYGFYPAYAGYGYGGGCYRKRVVYTPWGPRVRVVNVCY
jgi:hypothetical protein